VILARVRAALPATWLIVACNAACALAATLPLAAAVPAARGETFGVSLVLAALRLGERAQLRTAALGLLPLGLWLLLTPWLRLSWLRAHLRADTLSEHARYAARRYRGALTVWLAGLGYAALLLLMAALAHCLGVRALASTHDVRWQFVAGACAAGPWLGLWAVHAPCVSDLAYLELAAGGSVRQALEQGVRGARPTRLCARGGLSLLELALTLAALAVPRLWLGFGVTASVLAFVLTQLSAALSAGLRSLWLAWLCERAAPSAAGSDSAADRQATWI
jgi:hypothetical protein